MPRFRSFVQKRLAREANGEEGIVVRRQFPALHRGPGAPRRNLRVDEPLRFEAIAPKSTAEQDQKKVSGSIDDNESCLNGEGEKEHLQVAKSSASRVETSVHGGENRDDSDGYFTKIVNSDWREKLSFHQTHENPRNDGDSVTDIDALINTEDADPPNLTIQTTFCGSSIIDNTLAILSSKEDSRLEDIQGDAKLVVSRSLGSSETVGSEGSDLFASTAGIVEIIQTKLESSPDQEDQSIVAKVTAKENQVESATTQPQSTFSHIMTRDEDPDRSRYGTCISTALSSPSRRGLRSIKPKTRPSDDTVDSMIEISASALNHLTKTENCNLEQESPHHQSHNESATNSSNIPGEEYGDQIGDTVNPSTTSNNATTDVRVTRTAEQFSGHNAPDSLHDEHTMFPDNFPPLARYRY